jgi:hypothetical protein
MNADIGVRIGVFYYTAAISYLGIYIPDSPARAEELRELPHGESEAQYCTTEGKSMRPLKRVIPGRVGQVLDVPAMAQINVNAIGP